MNLLGRRAAGVLFVCAAISGASLIGGPGAQELDLELESTAHLLPDVGPGLRAIHHDAAGRLYVLSTPCTSISVYGPDSKLLRKIPSNPTKESSIVFAEDFDVDATGRVLVADRGANAIEIFDPAGRMQNSFQVNAPTSVAAITSGEIAITRVDSKRLVEVYDATGKLLRSFGKLENLADHPELNRSLNAGKLVADSASHLYFAFTFLPEPTVRRYDSFGNSTLEISLVTLEFEPAAQAARRQIWEQDQKPKPGTFRPVVNAIGVDEQTFDVWVAIDDELTHFDHDGGRVGETYRTFTADGERMAPTSMIVESNRLILAADPIGIYAFPRPDKAPGVAPAKPEDAPAAADKKP
jgi:hypothetical protein